ncbi:glucomannan 4-beta-mannosyltransferase 9-like [Fagus crenata]
MVFISIPNQTQTPPPFIPSNSPSSTKPTSPFITSSEFIYANPTLYTLKMTLSSSLMPCPCPGRNPNREHPQWLFGHVLPSSPISLLRHCGGFLDLVEVECQRWASKGINIKYEIRDNRTGYEAGALKEGMKHSYVKLCDYMVIFDADFQPEPDFLWRTIPFLVHNPDIALVQTRWKFVNADECLMTRMQEMSLDYHFTVEQEVGSVTYTFFGFNGTAGVWRISALNEAGGWKDRTTVEDMDLAVRASLKGWKFVYVGDIKVKNELPSTFKAFRYQQHQWSCGPANLFRKMAMEILRNKHFLCSEGHRLIAHTVTFFFYCVVLPATVLVPEVEVPKWGSVYIPSIITILNAVGTPRLHLLELGVGAYLFFCRCYDLSFGKKRYFKYLFLQSFAFFVAGVGYVGTFVPNS